MTPDQWQAEFAFIASQPFARVPISDAQRDELAQLAREENINVRRDRGSVFERPINRTCATNANTKELVSA